ncbi:hypothetical protein [Rhodococcus sp. RCBS9]|uniref:hypothetical protein n=1 Tax=Rhodococcus sp. RCBS9 TaxID=3031999 RepID=UPI00240282DC|nr:hypothetical protein [Rhodococcus sp. RCBS9]WEX07041.1 hypothetical protein P0M12_27445 [Rhodococcus sp. RCBS9]
MNESTPNPTIPLWMDITFTVFVLAWIFITISALVAIVRPISTAWGANSGGRHW